MDQFLEEHKLPQLIQYEADNLKNLVAIKEIEFVILKLQKRKCSDRDSFLKNYTKCIKINNNSTQKVEEVQIHFMKLIL